MKKYMVIDTGEIWTEEELKEVFEQFRDEMQYESFEEYMEKMLSQGRQRTGGLIEVEEN